MAAAGLGDAGGVLGADAGGLDAGAGLAAGLGLPGGGDPARGSYVSHGLEMSALTVRGIQ